MAPTGICRLRYPAITDSVDCCVFVLSSQAHGSNAQRGVTGGVVPGTGGDASAVPASTLGLPPIPRVPAVPVVPATPDSPAAPPRPPTPEVPPLPPLPEEPPVPT